MIWSHPVVCLAAMHHELSLYSHTPTDHGAYRRVVALGPSAVPVLLEDLAHGQGPSMHTMAALAELAGETPQVAPHYQGVVAHLAQWWLQWGQAQGHLDAQQRAVFGEGQAPAALVSQETVLAATHGAGPSTSGAR